MGLAAAKGLLVMEAMWTRFLPHLRAVRAWLDGGLIGSVRSLHADHTQRLPLDYGHRLNNPALAGGALLNLGVFPISFAHDVLGPVEHVEAEATFKPTRVDGSVATIPRHVGGAISTSYSASETRGPTRAAALGTEGRLELDATWYAPGTSDRVRRGQQGGRGVRRAGDRSRHAISSSPGGAPACSRPDRQPADGPAGSVEVMATLDGVRERIGLRYPEE